MSPADMFVDWYLACAQLNRPVSVHDPKLDRALDTALQLDDGTDCVEQLEKCAGTDPGRRVRVLELLDDAFSRIHPRGGSRVPGSRLPRWLLDAEALRRVHAHYTIRNNVRLIARGPLVRAAKDPHLDYREIFADRFPNVRLVDTAYTDESRRSIAMCHKELPQQAIFTVARRSEIGKEQVVFAPLLVGVREWDLSVCDDPNRGNLTVKPAKGVESALRLLDIIERAPAADIVISPEFSMPPQCGTILSDGLVKLAEKAPCLVLAGSGLTVETDDAGRPWNEACAYNQFGIDVIRQKKLSPSEICASRLLEIGVACVASRAIEATAEGSTLAVTDITDFGRVIVFICHDIKIQPLTTNVLGDFEPDWVLIPILDKEFDVGRWSHVEIFQRTNNSLQRFVACSSALWEVDGQFGMVHGPRCQDGEAVERRIAFVAAGQVDGTRDFGEIAWSSDDPRWKQSFLSVAEISSISDPKPEESGQANGVVAPADPAVVGAQSAV